MPYLAFHGIITHNNKLMDSMLALNWR